MLSTLAVLQSRVVPVGVDDAYAGTLPIPLTTIFDRWYGPIPPVAEVREQHGEWGTAGQSRVVAPPRRSPPRCYRWSARCGGDTYVSHWRYCRRG